MSSQSTRCCGIALLTALVFCGCTLPINAPTREMSITLLHHPYSCGTSDERSNLTVISDQNTFNGIWRRINQSLLTPPPMPETNFQRYVLVLVELGRRNNAGHELVLSAPSATKKGGDVTLPVAAIIPRSDAITPQVIVSPCLLAQVERQGVDTVQALSITRQVAVILTK